MISPISHLHSLLELRLELLGVLRVGETDGEQLALHLVVREVSLKKKADGRKKDKNMDLAGNIPGRTIRKPCRIRSWA